MPRLWWINGFLLLILQLTSSAIAREELIENEWIVVLKPDAVFVQDDGKTWMPSLLRQFDIEAEIIHHYSIPSEAGWLVSQISTTSWPKAFKGYAIRATKNIRRHLEKDPRVAYVEQNKRVWLDIIDEKPGNDTFPRYNHEMEIKSGEFKTTASQPNAPWNLARISQRDLPINSIFNYGVRAGGNVDAYVVDTGVYVEHTEFAPSRARWGTTFITNEPMQDLNGHGSHVAGLIGGNTWGTAKAVNIIAVKVLDAKGSGDWSGIIAGVNWVADQVSKSQRISVLNLSITGTITRSVNDAIANAIALLPNTLHVTAAAGNAAADACQYTPGAASSQGAISVASTDFRDVASTFSNWGPCVTIWAPGTGIQSVGITSNTASKIMSGTSMASPQVAGIAALYLSYRRGLTSGGLRSFLYHVSTSDKIMGMPDGAAAGPKSPNRLLYGYFVKNLPPSTQFPIVQVQGAKTPFY